MLHFTADTRYKLLVNGARVAVGPARSSPWIWYYDTVDIAPFLRAGENVVTFVVLRYFAGGRTAMPFSRTPMPGFTVVGAVHAGETVVDLDARHDWQAEVDERVLFPTGIIDDGFLHVRPCASLDCNVYVMAS